MAWTVRKWAVSAFVAFHVGAIALWNIPAGAIPERLNPWTCYYVMPTGQWQDWGMFAPDPPTINVSVEGLVLDNRGIVQSHLFPTLGERTLWQKFLHSRHAKLTYNIGREGAKVEREILARHVARTLDIPAEHYPIDVQLVYQVRPIPPMGTEDPAGETPRPTVLGTFRFPARAEVMP